MQGFGRRLPFSSFAGGGGRGRGRGLTPSLPPPISPDPEDPSVLPSVAHGRGRGFIPQGPQLPDSSNPRKPIFFVADKLRFADPVETLAPDELPLPQGRFSFPSSAGRGRGRGFVHQDPQPSNSPNPKSPIFSVAEKLQFADPVETLTPAEPRPPPPPLPAVGAGRGKPSTAAAPPRPPEINRHARSRSPAIGQSRAAAPLAGPKLSREEAVKKAMEVLSRGGDGGQGRPPRRGVERPRGRKGGDELKETEVDLGDSKDGERFVKRMGEERMKMVEAAFTEATSEVLPSVMDDLYLDALHTNNMIEYEPEYLVEFDRNPDIDEKPPMSLEEVLQKVKPFLMAYEGIKSQEEWEEIIKDLMERLPHMKELMDMYCGPDRVTAKQQQQELERVAKTIPENVPSSVKRFTDRAVLTLQSNAGWGWDKKCQFMDKLAWELNKQYK